MRMACILIGSYYVLCIPHILMASLYQRVLPLRSSASLSLIVISSCHAIDVETEAHTHKTEHDDQDSLIKARHQNIGNAKNIVRTNEDVRHPHKDK